MERAEYKKTAITMMRLIACALRQTSYTGEPVDLEKLFTVAGDHSLRALTAYALNTVGETPSPSFKESYHQSQRRTLLMDRERAHVLSALRENHIDHMILKGSVLKSVYPKQWLREMGDCDILIDASRADSVRDIMLSLGYEIKSFGEHHHDVYSKKPYFDFEMHRALFDPAVNRDFGEYYRDIFSRLIPCADSSCEFRFSDEDRCIYHILHAKLHHDSAGTGLRTVVDTFLLNQVRRDDFDADYVDRELRRLYADTFSRNLSSIAEELLSQNGGILSDAVDDYIFYGTHGTMKHLRENMISIDCGERNRSKLGYLKNRLRVPDRVLSRHPFIGRHRALTPILWVGRPVKRFATHPRAVLDELKYLVKYKK